MRTETITSRRNPLIQHVKKLLSDRSYRKDCGEYAADGTKLLEEALKWIPDQVRTVFVTSRTQIHEVPEHVRVVQVPDDIMEQISPMKTPQGALFTCALPEKEELTLHDRVLILDGIQDPGNLGTILRTADALEIPVVLTPDCADVHSHKTVRAAMGAVFRTPPQLAQPEQVLAACKQQDIPVYVTALSSRAVDLRKADLSKAALVIGSEGQGVRPHFLEHADAELIIPMNSRCESLNAAVAAAIVMWQMKR